jgi:hypothetical protein
MNHLKMEEKPVNIDRACRGHGRTSLFDVGSGVKRGLTIDIKEFAADR